MRRCFGHAATHVCELTQSVLVFVREPRARVAPTPVTGHGGPVERGVLRVAAYTGRRVTAPNYELVSEAKRRQDLFWTA